MSFHFDTTACPSCGAAATPAPGHARYLECTSCDLLVSWFGFCTKRPSVSPSRNWIEDDEGCIDLVTQQPPTYDPNKGLDLFRTCLEALKSFLHNPEEGLSILTSEQVAKAMAAAHHLSSALEPLSGVSGFQDTSIKHLIHNRVAGGGRDLVSKSVSTQEVADLLNEMTQDHTMSRQPLGIYSQQPQQLSSSQQIRNPSHSLSDLFDSEYDPRPFAYDEDVSSGLEVEQILLTQPLPMTQPLSLETEGLHEG